MSYINETDFVIENKKLVYPEIVADGLQLYYDAKGKRDTDYHRDTMLDMSGNKNHGKLHNFAYEKSSGYKDGLVFDYIDDKLIRPALNLQPDDFTFILNGNIISFSPDGTIKRVQDGEVIERKGINLIKDSFYEKSIVKQTDGNTIVVATKKVAVPNFIEGHYYLTTYESKHNNTVSAVGVYPRANVVIGNPVDKAGGDTTSGIWDKTVKIDKMPSGLEGPVQMYLRMVGGFNSEVEYRNLQLIDLTETFGAGNEPTLEEIQAEPDKWQWIPNPLDLAELEELKGNTLGDIENIIDGLYKTEVLSDEEVYTDKADGDAGVHVEVDGKSYQSPILLENLFTKKEVTGNTYATYTDVYVTFNQGNTYYTRRNFSGIGSSGSYGSIRSTGGGGTHIFVGNSQLGDYSQVTTFSYETRETQVMFYGYNNADNGVLKNTITDTFIIDLTKHFGAGNEPTKEEMDLITNQTGWFSGVKEVEISNFDKTTPPSPDYPIEIHSLNDVDVVSSVGGRNLVLNSSTLEASGLGAVSGTRAEYQTIKTGESYMDLEDGETITISFDIEMRIAKANPTLQVYNSNVPGPVGVANVSVGNQLQGDVGETINKRISFTTHATLRDSPRYSSNTLEFYSNYGSDNFYRISKLKVERGNKATPWTPAPEDITEDSNHPLIDKINLLLSEPLRSVGDVKDRLFRDSDGVWKIERRVWKDLVNGSQVLKYPSFPVAGYTKFYYTNLTKPYIQPKSDVMTNLLPSLETNLGYANSGQIGASIYSSGTGKVIYGTIETSRLTSDDTAGLVAYFTDNPLIVHYQLANPIIETLSQSLQDKLNNIRSFEDSNYVYTVYGSTNLLDTVPLLNNHWYPSSGTLQNPVTQNGHTSTQEPLPVYPGAKIHLTKETTVDNYWRIVWVGKDNNVVIREVSTVNDLVLTAPNGAYGMRVSYPNGSNPVIKFDKSGITQTVAENLKPTLHAKFLYNNWYKEDRVINNLMIYNRALTNEEMLQNYKTVKRRWGM